MFDVNTISKRYFNVKIGDLTLDVEPPKLKVLKKITALSNARDEDAMEDLTQAVKMILSKNKTKYAVPDETIDNLNFDELQQILTAYFEWLAEEKKSPN